MDYETPDGSHFSLLEIYESPNGHESFSYTSVTAFVDGEAFAGRLEAHIEDADDGDMLSCLSPVPLENVYPLQPSSVTIVQDCDPATHYVKAPSFTFEDSLPDRTFVADCMLREVMLYELLRQQPHPGLAEYNGCMVDTGRIRRIVLKRYQCNLVQYAQSCVLDMHKASHIFDQVLAAVKHLHALGRAHNDISPYNICIDDDGHAVVIDLDACLPFGQPLLKGTGIDDEKPLSSVENDWLAMDELDDFLKQHAVS